MEDFSALFIKVIKYVRAWWFLNSKQITFDLVESANIVCREFKDY